MTVPEVTLAPDRSRSGGPTPLALAGLLALGHCAAFADRNLPGVAAPLLKADLRLSDAQLGLLMGPAFAVLYAAGMLLALPLSRSRYRFRLLATCIATWGLGMAAFALARSFTGLLAARALVGLGQSVFVPLALGVIVDEAEPRWRGRSMAIFTAGSAIGRSMALLLGGTVLALLALWLPEASLPHWRWMFLIMAAPNLVLIAVLLRCSERPPPTTASVAGFAPILRWLRGRPLLVALYLYGAGGSVLVVQTVGAWAPSILHREQGLTVAQSALAFGGLLLFASPLGHMLAGALLDRRGQRLTPTAIVAAGLLLAVPLLGLLPLAGSPATACLLMALVSLAAGAAAVAALAGLPAVIPAPLRGTAVCLFLVYITLVGVGLGPLLAGVVSDGLGLGGKGLSTALCLVCASVAASGVVAARLAQPGWRQAAEEVAA